MELSSNEQEFDPLGIRSEQQFDPLGIKSEKPVKKVRPGIIYLSYIPFGIDKEELKELLSPYGEIGRVYLVFDHMNEKFNKKVAEYKEGWVEFKKKKHAKYVAEALNGCKIGGRRKAIYRDSIWAIRYLHRFTWDNLTERLKYERAVKKLRMRKEMGAARKEARLYAAYLDRNARHKRIAKAQGVREWDDGIPGFVRQEPTCDKQLGEGSSKSLFGAIFPGSSK